MEKGRQADPGELPHEGPWLPLAELDKRSRHQVVSTIFQSVRRDVQYQLLHTPPKAGEPNQYSFMAIGGADYDSDYDTRIFLAFIGSDETLLRVFDTKELDLHIRGDEPTGALPDELLEWVRDDMLEQARLGTARPNAADILQFIDVVESWSKKG